MSIYTAVPTKFCHKCKTEKPISEFNQKKSRKDCLQTQCRECMKLQTTNWNESNKEKLAVTKKAWKNANKDKMCAADAKRRATKLQATPFWTETKQNLSVFKEAKRIEKETGIKQHVDHIVPLISDLVCGLHVFANLRIIPASENCAKGNRHWPDMP